MDAHDTTADDTADDTALDVEHDIDQDAVPVLEPVSDPVETARRRHGAAGAVLAAGMFGVDIALGRKPKEDAPIVVSASDEPTDIEQEGIVVPIDDRLSAYAPPQPRADPFPPKRKRR